MSVDYPDFGAPQANATAISTTGVPLITNVQPLATISQVAPAGGLVTIGPFFPTSPSYEIWLNSVMAASGATGPLLVSVGWYDDAGFNIISNEEYTIWPAALGGQHFVIGRGPCKGQALYITFQSYGLGANTTVTGAIYERSHIYTRDNWYTRFQSASASGVAMATYDTSALLVGAASVSVGAASVVAFELPLAIGPVFIHAETASLTTDMRLALLNSAGEGNLGLGTILARYSSDSNGFINQELTLPRYQCKLQMSNSNAAAKVLQFNMHLLDQPA